MTNREKVIQLCYYTINDLSVINLVSGSVLFTNLRNSLEKTKNVIIRMESIEEEDEELIYSYPLLILIKGFRYFFDIKTIRIETINYLEIIALKIASDWSVYNDFINYKSKKNELIEPIFKASEIEEIKANLDKKDDSLRKFALMLNKKDRIKLASRYLEYNDYITVDFIKKERLDFLNEAIEYYNNSHKIIDESLTEANRLKGLDAITQEEYQIRINSILRDKMIVNKKLETLTIEKNSLEKWLKNLKNN